MEKKYTIQIGEKLYNEIKDYCSINGLKINSFIEKILSKYFRKEKYGNIPFGIVEDEEYLYKDAEVSGNINDNCAIPLKDTPMVFDDCQVKNGGIKLDTETKPILTEASQKQNEENRKKKVIKLK